MSAEERLKRLEEVILNGAAKSNGLALSVETLLDALLVLYDECNSAALRREKNISEFVESGKPVILCIVLLMTAIFSAILNLLKPVFSHNQRN